MCCPSRGPRGVTSPRQWARQAPREINTLIDRFKRNNLQLHQNNIMEAIAWDIYDLVPLDERNMDILLAIVWATCGCTTLYSPLRAAYRHTLDAWIEGRRQLINPVSNSQFVLLGTIQTALRQVLVYGDRSLGTQQRVGYTNLVRVTVALGESCGGKLCRISRHWCCQAAERGGYNSVCTDQQYTLSSQTAHSRDA